MPLKLGALLFLIHYAKHDGCLILKGEMVRNQHIPLVLCAYISQRGLRGVAEINDRSAKSFTVLWPVVHGLLTVCPVSFNHFVFSFSCEMTTFFISLVK